MRGLFFGGGSKRNDPIKLENPRPVPDYGIECLESGDAGRDGFTVLSKADPNRQGDPPVVKGTVGRVYRGPDQSFEQ